MHQSKKVILMNNKPKKSMNSTDELEERSRKIRFKQIKKKKKQTLNSESNSKRRRKEDEVFELITEKPKRTIWDWIKDKFRQH